MFTITACMRLQHAAFGAARYSDEDTCTTNHDVMVHCHMRISHTQALHAGARGAAAAAAAAAGQAASAAAAAASSVGESA